MAIGSIADAVVKSDFAHQGIIEGVAQNLRVFNELSNGAIRLLDPVNKPGYNADNIYFSTFEDFTTRQNVASGGNLSSDDIGNITDIQEREVKLNRKTVVQQDEQFFRKGASGLQGGADELRVKLESGFVMSALKKQINDAIAACATAIRSQTALKYDRVTIGSNTGFSVLWLNNALALLKDLRDEVRCLVMNHESYRQLVADNVGRAISNVGGAVLREGTTATYGLPVLVTNAPALSGASIVGSAGSATDYLVLCLKENAVTVTVTEQYAFDMWRVPGKEIPTWEMFGRWAHNIRVKGLSWKTDSEDNPTDAQLTTTTKWELKASSAERAAGAVLIHA